MMTNTLTVLDEAYVKYSRTTWQGEVEINGEAICYRYSEDDNGIEMFILTDNGWEDADLSEDGPMNHRLLWGTIQAWGNPEELGGSADGPVDLDMTEIEDYI
jgi:hypothetical protein